MMTTLYALRSTAQCNPDADNACVRSMNGNANVGRILGDKHWRWTDINAVYRKTESYNYKDCGCRAEVIEIIDG